MSLLAVGVRPSLAVASSVVGGWVAVARSVNQSKSIDRSRVRSSIRLSVIRVGGRVAVGLSLHHYSRSISRSVDRSFTRTESVRDLSLDGLRSSFRDELRQSIQDLVLA